MAGGRPTKYRKRYCKEIVEYFKLPLLKLHKQIKYDNGTKRVEIKEVPTFPTLAGFAVQLGICKDTIWQWSTKHPEFFSAIKECKAIQEQLLVHNGLHGFYDKTITIFCLKNLADWKDRVESKNNTNMNFTLSYNLDEGDKE